MAPQRARDAGGDRTSPPPDSDWARRLATIEARTEHLERQLEGLQDALYRQATLEDENIGELRRRMAPEQLARDLDRDARKRGL